MFNGDLFSVEDVAELQQQDNRLSGVMLGRGLVGNPALARQLQGGAPLQKEEIIRFHDALTDNLSRMYDPNIVFMKLRVVMKHLVCCFDAPGKLEKQIRKSRNLTELLATDRLLFAQCEALPQPVFVPDEAREDI